jgi:hypothetical protein
MRIDALRFIVVSSLVVSSAPAVVSQQPEPAETFAVVGRVQQAHPPRLFTVENRLTEHRQLLVLAPEGFPLPQTGSMVHARGVLRRVDKAELNSRAWSALDQRAQESFAGRPILVASSLIPAVDSQVNTGLGLERPALPVRLQTLSRKEITVRPEALASLIEELAGFQVRMPYARVVGLFDSRAFLVDSAMHLPAPLGHRDRVLVLLDAAALRAPAESLVASTVTIQGVARTVLGVQTSGEVPWPVKLDRGALKRLEVRAAVLATSVRTADGVELTDR